MEDNVRKIVRLSHEQIDEGMFEFPFYNRKGSSFVDFIVSDRLVPFLKLVILNIADEDWFIGFESCERHSEDDESTAIFGPSLVKKKFSSEEVFNYVLSHCEFPQVIITNPADWKGDEQFFVSEIPLKKERELDFNREEVFLSKSLIFSSNMIYVSKKYANKVSEILAFHTAEFDAMINKYKDEPTIPHTVYLEWLLEYLPGKIHIRSIGKY